MVAGTNRAVSFDLLCERFGKDRCIGFDLYNPSNHDRVRQFDCMEFSDDDVMPIAFAHNDVGSMSHTPEVKIHTHKWLTKNLIKGGCILGNNNLNRAKFKFEEYMIENGCENTHFSDLDDTIFDLSIFPQRELRGI